MVALRYIGATKPTGFGDISVSTGHYADTSGVCMKGTTDPPQIPALIYNLDLTGKLFLM